MKYKTFKGTDVQFSAGDIKEKEELDPESKEKV